MRTRAIALGATLSVALGLVTAAPASAAYGVTIAYPGGETEFYSPFGGPATITFAFAPDDPAELFRVRLRPVGGRAIKTAFYSINPATQSSPVVKQFSWTPLSTTVDKPYEVLVNPDGEQALDPVAFVLHPQLVRITGISPNPFFPRIDDGYRDVTHIRYSLGNDADVEVHVHLPRSTGACCGSIVRNEDLGMQPEGANVWDWDGRNDGGSNLPVGHYFVRVRADDGALEPAVSKAAKVTIKRSYRTTATSQKSGKSYHHTSESVLVRGGDCFTFSGANYLEVSCHGAKMSVFYRWGLGTNEWITKASFVIDNPNGECGTAKWDPGHSKRESFVTVTDNVAGNTACRIVTARITYSYLKAS